MKMFLVSFRDVNVATADDKTCQFRRRGIFLNDGFPFDHYPNGDCLVHNKIKNLQHEDIRGRAISAPFLGVADSALDNWHRAVSARTCPQS